MKLTNRNRPARDTDSPPSLWRLAAAALILAGAFLALIVLFGN